ncbi:MAG: DUF1028 domain-containing protein [Ignavibacteriales bacterium]|nr:DUF1028 domain-containing protein [Ignavibacteriales bacterium]
MKYILLIAILCSLAFNPVKGQINIGTYSIVGWDSLTGDLGVAVQSKFLGVGAVVPFAKAGVGAVATQAYANTTFGPKGLSLLEKGLSASEVAALLLASDSGIAERQLGIVDSKGNSFAHTGSKCLEYAGHITGKGYSVQGNILAGREVVNAMARAFETTDGDLATKLLSALDAAEKAGGDKRGRQSAALLVVREKGGYAGFDDSFIDIRVDDDSLPLVELRRLYNLWQSTFLFESRFRSIKEFEKQKKYIAADTERRRVTQEFNIQLRNRPDDPKLLNEIAWLLATNDIDKMQALELAKRAVRLLPSDLNILETLAECHYQLQHYDEAIAIQSELVAKDPSNDSFWKQLQKFKEAKSTLK